jgi:hypothetical protein
MPIIKDKYGAKGAQTRSKFVTRTKNRAILTESIATNVKTTSQKQAEQTKITQELINPITENINQQTISGTKLSVANTVELISTLVSGEKLEDIIISHYSASGASTVGLYWSTSLISELTFTVSSGVITAISGGTAYRLLTETFPSGTTLSLASSGMFNTFNNISKDIRLYAVCSVLGPQFTIVKS